MKYVALLRGINVGGGKKVEMKRLKEMMQELGYQQITTLLNSGNVVFSSTNSAGDIKKSLEEKIELTFGFAVPVLIRTDGQLQQLIESDPFGTIQVMSETRLYITFISQKPTSKFPTPYVSPDKNFSILKVTDTEIISVLTVSKEYGTTDVMKILEKEFGKEITTRNWNTVQKIHARISS